MCYNRILHRITVFQWKRDRHVEFYDCEFEWDENKNKTNVEKHGVPFQKGCEMEKDRTKY